VLKTAATRGWKLGAARHRYREKFGVWPKGPRATALEREHYPTPTVDELAARAPEAPAQVAWSWSPGDPLPAEHAGNPFVAAVAEILTEAPLLASREIERPRVRRIDLTKILATEPAPAAAVEEWTL
jgi:hypothetical protein